MTSPPKVKLQIPLSRETKSMQGLIILSGDATYCQARSSSDKEKDTVTKETA